jgi:hemerythrin
MIFFTWQEAYLTHISEIDGQHQKLVALINALYSDLLGCQDNDQKRIFIIRTLEELIDYSFYHFITEEELLRKYDYPKYEEHKQEHEQFKLKIAQFMKEQESVERVLPFPIVVFLRDWLISHVLTTDKEYSAYLNEKMSNQ